MNTWHRFTPNSRSVVFKAQAAAQEQEARFVTARHLLVGILRESDSLAHRVLVRLEADLDCLESDALRNPPADREMLGMTLSDDAKQVIDLADAQSKALGDKHIGTEHLLLGMLCTDAPIATLLAAQGVDWSCARGAVNAIRETE